MVTVLSGEWYRFRPLLKIAIIISIFSLGFSIFYSRKTFRLTEKHNLKSVEPLLDSNYSRSFTDDKKYIKQYFEIKNCGLGPAKINSFYFIIDGEEYEDMRSLYESKLGLPPKYEELGEVWILKDCVIASNEVRKIFDFYYLYITNEDGNAYFSADYDELTDRISIKIEYETIYGGKRSLYIKSLSSF